MKRLIVFAICILAVTAAFSQSYAIKGRAVDSKDAETGLPAATVRLIKGDSVLVAAAADSNGYFELTVDSCGHYKLDLSYVGYDVLVKNIELTDTLPVLELGSLLLSPGMLLGEVTVTGLAQELTIKADTFVYHASAYRVPEGSTIAALIKQLPGLSMDSEGNLTFQGKAVSSILVNGQPFIGDANTAMSNIVSDAVENVAVYEKTDEESEFAGVIDIDKATVVDLQIKDEYMSSWNVNADAGAGTHNKYIAKFFASNFTDKRRTAVYAQVNNISENQTVDENGNWQNNSWMLGGLYTYRKAGAIMSYNNELKNTDAGYFKINTSVELGHDSDNFDNIVNNETLLGSAGSHFGYSRSLQAGRDRNFSAEADFVFNSDTLNRFSGSIFYNYGDTRTRASSNSSTYSAAVDFDSPERGLVGDDVSAELSAIGINSRMSQSLYSSRRNNFEVDARYLHRFRKEGFSLNAGISYSFSNAGRKNDNITDYRYFNSGENSFVDRRYSTTPDKENRLDAKVEFNGAFSKHIKFTVSYSFNRIESSEDDLLYRLSRYPYYSQPGLPLGIHPSTADSLAAVIDVENSIYSQRTELRHRVAAVLNGVWEKFEISARATAYHYDESLEYRRAGIFHTPSRNYFEVSPYVTFKWKPVKNGEISIYYNGYQQRPSLLELLPITDTSSEMVERVNNPGLKIQWNNYFGLYGRWFNESRGDSYYINANGGVYNNSVVDIISTDPSTGKTRITKDNVNGKYYFYIGISTEQPLDEERHWTLSAGGGYNVNHNKNYVGAMGNELGLSVVNYYNPRANIRLKWRSGMWSVNLGSVYFAEISRYKSTPEYNQEGHTFECSLQPQVDLPFGLKINTSFMFYGRRGYESSIMNHDQWLWNATISQSFLKNKALTLQLEAVDLLHQRTSEYSSISPQRRYFSREKAFFSYVMLHAIYRFNIGGE